MDKGSLSIIQNEFCSRYLAGTVGTVEDGGDDSPVRLTTVATSSNASDSYVRSFGCDPGTPAILAEFVAIEPAMIPKRHFWVIFPKMYRGLPVFYRSGGETTAY